MYLVEIIYTVITKFIDNCSVKQKEITIKMYFANLLYAR